MIYEFDGMTTEQYNSEDRKNFYDYMTSRGFLIDKQPINVILNDNEIELYLYIEYLNMSDYGDYDEHIVSMGVIPSFESLSKTNQVKILDQFSNEDKMYFEKHANELLTDIIDYGFNISLKTETVIESEVKYTIESAITTRYGVKGLIGFELDKRVNMIGNTGWDLLESYCNDVDIIQIALNRYNNNEE